MAVQADPALIKPDNALINAAKSPNDLKGLKAFFLYIYYMPPK